METSDRTTGGGPVPKIGSKDSEASSSSSSEAGRLSAETADVDMRSITVAHEASIATIAAAQITWHGCVEVLRKIRHSRCIKIRTSTNSTKCRRAINKPRSNRTGSGAETCKLKRVKIIQNSIQILGKAFKV